MAEQTDRLQGVSRALRGGKVGLACIMAAMLRMACPAAAAALIDLPAPIDEWVCGVPLGNARTGAMLWGGGDTLNVTLDCQDFWHISENDGFRSPAFNWTNFVAYTKRTYEERIKIFEVRTGDPCKLPGVRLVAKLAGGAKLKRFSLDGATAVATVTVETGKGEERRLRAWFDDDGATHLSLAKPADVSFESLHFTTNRAYAKLPPYPEPEIEIRADGATYRRANRPAGKWAHPFEAGVRILPEDAVRDDGWWRRFHAESEVSVPDPLVQNVYDFAMYLYGAGSRVGCAPMALQGVWSSDNGDLPPWHGDYHHDLNSEMTYWAAHVANHFDSHDAYTKHVVQLLPEFERYAKRFFGVRGAAIPGHMAYDGSFIAGGTPWAISPTHGLWSFTILYEGWAYRPTKERLEEIWPLGVALAEAADSIMGPPDADGIRRWPVSVSPEVGGPRNEAFLPPNTSYDRSITLGFFTQMAVLARAKGEMALAERYSGIARSAGPAHLDEKGRYLVAEGIPLAKSHHHFSHMMDVFPYDQADPRADARATLNAHEDLGLGGWAGHSFSQGAVMWARAGDGDRAREQIRIFREEFCAPNGFHLNAWHRERLRRLELKKPFTVEANVGIARAVQEMLLQSRPGEIRIFPALPRAWDGKEVSFRDLVVVGGHRVSARRSAEGRITYSIKKFSDEEVKVVLPPGEQDFAAVSGGPNPPYADELRDRCWMFGHDPGVYDRPGNSFNIPPSAPVTMAEACRIMGVPNVCVVKWDIPTDAYLEQFRGLKRVDWVVDNGDIHNHGRRDIMPRFVDAAIERMPKMPNLVAFEFDDFFYWPHQPLHRETVAGGASFETLPGSHSLAEVRHAISRLRSCGRKVEIRLVFYSRDLAAGEATRAMVDLVDTVMFWTWQAKNLKELRPNFNRYRELYPDKPTLLGIYMWDFGGNRPIGTDVMKAQLDFALEQFRLGRIDGVLFHCTPLMNKNLPEVDMCREWVRAHGREKAPCRP
ncbi:MAG: hypothetical protein IKO72_08295 [Kiritimatiellae bacterium]|nr:hypothetical protein [Kiritimatiellia bacterium]